MSAANPRTGVCIHADGRSFVLIVVDGRAPGRTGMRGITFGRFARHVLGCERAVMLDGGGSSELFVRGQPGFEGRPAGVVNRTSDGVERTVCCHLGVRIDEAIAPDAGTSVFDAGQPSADASVDALDAGASSPDSGVVDPPGRLDASRPPDSAGLGDAAVTSVDAGARRAALEGACGCRTVGLASGSPRGLFLACVSALVFVARRTTRRRCRAGDSPGGSLRGSRRCSADPRSGPRQAPASARTSAATEGKRGDAVCAG
jgi:hypothetical protein